MSNSMASTRLAAAEAAPIEKALILYDALCGARPAMRLSELSKTTGLPKTTTHRLLSSLTTAGLVVRFGVGYAAAERRGVPGVGVASHELLRRLAPFLGDLMARTSLTASLAVLNGADVVFAHRVYSHYNVCTNSDDSGRALAHRTAAGRLLLSYDVRAACELAESWDLARTAADSLQHDLLGVRSRRLATVVTPDITCLAVPLPVGPDRPPIAFTVKGRTGTVDHDRAVVWLRRIADVAARSVVLQDAA